MRKGAVIEGQDGKARFKTVDMDFVTFLISQRSGIYKKELVADDSSDTGFKEVLVPMPPMLVELDDAEPFEDDAARSRDRNIKYVFVLKNMMPIPTAEFDERIKRLEMEFLSQNLLVEPISLRGAFRQIRRWMNETDKARLVKRESHKGHNR